MISKNLTIFTEKYTGKYYYLVMAHNKGGWPERTCYSYTLLEDATEIYRF